MTGNEVEASATISTILGDIKVPLSHRQWKEVMSEMAEDEGWDVAIARVGISPALDMPRVVGVVIRVPKVSSPENAAVIAMNYVTALIDSGVVEMRDGETTKTTRVVIFPYDTFGEED